MLLLSLLLATHIPQEDYLRCQDYEWLRNGVNESDLFSPSEKSDMILHWIEHTDPQCFT